MYYESHHRSRACDQRMATRPSHWFGFQLDSLALPDFRN